VQERRTGLPVAKIVNYSESGDQQLLPVACTSLRAEARANL